MESFPSQALGRTPRPTVKRSTVCATCEDLERDMLLGSPEFHCKFTILQVRTRKARISPCLDAEVRARDGINMTRARIYAKVWFGSGRIVLISPQPSQWASLRLVARSGRIEWYDSRPSIARLISTQPFPIISYPFPLLGGFRIQLTRPCSGSIKTLISYPSRSAPCLSPSNSCS